MKRVLLACLTAIGILFAGCDNEPNEGNRDANATSSISITIKNENNNDAMVRVVGDDPDQALENTVHSFAVFVFNAVDLKIEKSKVFLNTTTGRVDKLYAGSKIVSVLVNSDDYSFIDNIEEYSDLDNMTLNLDSQIPGDFTTYGLFMSGKDSSITLTPDEERDVTINVRRVAAKVKLGSLTIAPDTGSSLSSFTLKGVCVQKVPYFAYVLGDVIPDLDDDEYIGGLSGSVSAPIPGKTGLLYEDLSSFDITQPITPKVYFYVFPNDNSAGKPTLLTICGTYNGTDAYYTFPINSSTVNGGDGKYIERNKVYTLDVTLRDLRNHLSDPDAVSGNAVINVIVATDDWEGYLGENPGW